MKSSQKSPASASAKWYKKPWFAAVVVIAFLLALYGFSELTYQSNISAMQSGIEKAKSELVGPKGGQEKSAPVVTHGAHVLDKMGCIDTNCPQVESTWQVPLATDEVAQFKSEVTVAIKSKQAGDMFFDREKWQVNIFISPVADAREAAPSGKEWQSVHIFVYE